MTNFLLDGIVLATILLGVYSRFFVKQPDNKQKRLK